MLWNRGKDMSARSVDKPQIFKTLVSMVCLCFLTSQAIAAANPEEVIKGGTDRVLEILSEHHENTEARIDKIRAIVDDYFDFEAMARCVLGPLWDNQTPEKQQEFTQDFSKLMTNTVGKIGNFANGSITYTRKQMGQDHAVVEALVSGIFAGQFAIDYYMYLKDGNWKVNDVAVQGTSLIRNYRCQFAAILSRDSFDDLLKQMERKIAQG